MVSVNILTWQVLNLITLLMKTRQQKIYFNVLFLQYLKISLLVEM